MKRLLAALAALLLSAMPVKAAEPSLTLDTPGPHHYGGTIVVTTHGDLPKPGKPNAENSKIQLSCEQGGLTVYRENVDDPAEDTSFTLHLGQWGLSQWDLNGGGAADCVVRLAKVGNHPVIYTSIAFHVDP